MVPTAGSDFQSLYEYQYRDRISHILIVSRGRVAKRIAIQLKPHKPPMGVRHHKIHRIIADAVNSFVSMSLGFTLLRTAGTKRFQISVCAETALQWKTIIYMTESDALNELKRI